MHTIKVQFDLLVTSRQIIIPAGQSNFSYLKFYFSPEWEGYNTIAQFVQGENIYNVSINEENICYVPNELEVGKAMVYLRGYKNGEQLSIGTTNGAEIKIVQGAVEGGVPSVPLTPTLCYVETINGTMANPWGDKDVEQLMQELDNNNITMQMQATMGDSIFDLRTFKTTSFPSGIIASEGNISSDEMQVVVGSIHWNTEGEATEAYFFEGNTMNGRLTNLLPIATNFQSVLTIIHHPLSN